MLAHHAIMGMYQEGVINVQRIADVLREWQNPTFAYEELAERSAWRLFNAATIALNGRVIENSAATVKLHRVIDSVCEHVNKPQAGLFSCPWDLTPCCL